MSNNEYEIDWELVEYFPGVMFKLNIKATGAHHIFSNEKELVDYIKSNNLEEGDYEAFTELMTTPSNLKPLVLDFNQH